MIVVSDIHLNHDAARNPSMLETIKSVAGRDQHRTLILAGDLTSCARQSEYEQVCDWLRGLVNEGVSVVLAPGNHDTSQSILVARVRLEKGCERYAALAGLIARQPSVVARRDVFDMIYRIGKDVFFAARSTHHRLHKPTRIKRKQFEWAKLVLRQEGLLPETGYRLHLVTHQSLWKLPSEGEFRGDSHTHMHKRSRLRDEFLKPLGFATAINGHNHGFTQGMQHIKDDLAYRIYHIQAPTLSEHKTKGGRCFPGYVTWDPESPGSAAFHAAQVP